MVAGSDGEGADVNVVVKTEQNPGDDAASPQIQDPADRELLGMFSKRRIASLSTFAEPAGDEPLRDSHSTGLSEGSMHDSSPNTRFNGGSGSGGTRVGPSAQHPVAMVARLGRGWSLLCHMFFAHFAFEPEQLADMRKQAPPRVFPLRTRPRAAAPVACSALHLSSVTPPMHAEPLSGGAPPPPPVLIGHAAVRAVRRWRAARWYTWSSTTLGCTTCA